MDETQMNKDQKRKAGRPPGSPNKGTKRVSLICDCGTVARRIKSNCPVCERCHELERAGCTGGPMVKDISTTISAKL